MPQQPTPEQTALFAKACQVKANAYAPYSQFHVGAVLLTDSGREYTGVNVENAAYPLGICAERSAISAAITAGERRFTAIAICGERDTEPCFPCGACRQVLAEHCSSDLAIVLADGVYRLAELLPYAFALDPELPI